MEKGAWQVVRFCCTSGQCIECRALANGTKRKRVVHIHGISEDAAKVIAGNWRSYGATAEPMVVDKNR